MIRAVHFMPLGIRQHFANCARNRSVWYTTESAYVQGELVEELELPPAGICGCQALAIPHAACNVRRGVQRPEGDGEARRSYWKDLTVCRALSITERAGTNVVQLMARDGTWAPEDVRAESRSLEEADAADRGRHQKGQDAPGVQLRSRELGGEEPAWEPETEGRGG